MKSVDLYQQLADAYHHQGKFPERDRFLVLAMDAANEAGQAERADQVRRQLLEMNPNHLIKPYPTAKEALQAPNFANYLGQLRKNFPPAKAQALLGDVSQTVARPRPTMLAPEPQFPTADPVSDQTRPPKWSNVEVEVRHKPSPPPAPPPVFTFTAEPPPVQSPRHPVADPLAHIPPPQSRQPQVDNTFRLAPPPVTAAPKDVVPPARSRSAEQVYSPSGATIGNFLFVVVLLASLATVGYVFIWPLL